MIGRRELMQALAACAILPGAALRAQSRVITTPIALEETRLWIAATIGGSQPLQFIIDTGVVVSLIQARIASALGMHERGRTRLVGTGGTEDFRLYEGRDVVFSSGAVQHSMVFGAMPTSLVLGREAAGAFSAGLVTESDSDLDFGRGEWRLYPDGRGARDGYRELPSSIEHFPGNETGSAYMLVDAALGDNNFRFILDTGMPGQVKLYPWAVRRSGLWNDAGPYAPDRGAGIGGVGAPGRTVRGGTLRIGDFAFERPLVFLNRPSSVAHQDFADGVIGLSFIELLNLSTDVRRRRLWAQPSGRPQRQGRYRLGGFWAEERHGVLVVTDVGPGSPAAEAGLRIGDELPGLSMADFLNRVAGRAGDSFALSYRRGGETRSTRLILREFL